MPTEAHNTVLDRDLSIVAARPLIDVASPLLRELVNNATWVLVRCLHEASEETDQHAAPLALYRQIISSLDAIEVLVSQSCAESAIPILRSSFEALLALEFILEDETTYRSRSLAWLVNYTRRRINLYDTIDVSSDKGKDLQSALNTDPILFQVQLLSKDQAEPNRLNLEQLLGRPHLMHVASKFDAHRKKHHRLPSWYSLDGGPPNLRELAKRLRREAQYVLLYKQWSLTVHAQDLQSLLALTQSGEPALARLRDPGDINHATAVGHRIILDATNLILSKFRPGEDTNEWYAREIEPYLRRLASQ